MVVSDHRWCSPGDCISSLFLVEIRIQARQPQFAFNFSFLQFFLPLLWSTHSRCECVEEPSLVSNFHLEQLETNLLAWNYQKLVVEEEASIQATNPVVTKGIRGEKELATPGGTPWYRLWGWAKPSLLGKCRALLYGETEWAELVGGKSV